jgi:hypothetical protein
MDQHNMNGDTLAIMQAISDSRNELTKAIGELDSKFAGFKGGMDERVTELEAKQEKAGNRQWYHSLIVFAVGVIHHDLGQWLNLKF